MDAAGMLSGLLKLFSDQSGGGGDLLSALTQGGALPTALLGASPEGVRIAPGGTSKTPNPEEAPEHLMQRRMPVAILAIFEPGD